jgi:DNA-binding transcriptional regulator GbsR (MarR family)
LEENDYNGKIDYTISCKNSQGNTRSFEGTVDFSILSRRSEANEIWETDPMEDISNEIEKIRKDIRKISRYTDQEKKTRGWEKQKKQTETILRYIHDFGPIEVDELQELTGVRKPNMMPKIERLDKYGAIYHNEETGLIRLEQGSGPNKTINDDYD